MGYYIQTASNKNKAHDISTANNGRIVPKPANYAEIPEDKALIVVINNGLFEAAGLAFSEREFQDFTLPSDGRSKEFVLLDKKVAYELAGYKS